MFHQVFDNEDLGNKTVEYPSNEPKDCGKIRFEFHNNLILSMQEQLMSTMVPY